MIDIRQFGDADDLEEIIIKAASDTSVPYSTLVERVEDLEITEEMYPDMRETEVNIETLQQKITALENTFTRYKTQYSASYFNNQKRV